MHNKPHSYKTKLQISSKKKGIPLSQKNKVGIGKGLKKFYSKNKVWNKGVSHTKEQIEKMKGRKPWNKGKKMPKELVKKIVNTRRKNDSYHQTEDTKKRISENISGEKHPMWLGGISKLPYSIDWKETLRKSIRERDSYQCQLCGKPQGKRKHSVHHIDYDKLNANPNNLITLCHLCHMKTNLDRDKWKKYFYELRNN